MNLDLHREWVTRIPALRATGYKPILIDIVMESFPGAFMYDLRPSFSDPKFRIMTGIDDSIEGKIDEWRRLPLDPSDVAVLVKWSDVFRSPNQLGLEHAISQLESNPELPFQHVLMTAYGDLFVQDPEEFGDVTGWLGIEFCDFVEEEAFCNPETYEQAISTLKSYLQ